MKSAKRIWGYYVAFIDGDELPGTEYTASSNKSRKEGGRREAISNKRATSRVCHI